MLLKIYSHLRQVIFLLWLGTAEKEAEFVLKQTLQHIVLTALHPNTAISVIVQVRCTQFRLGGLLSLYSIMLKLKVVHTDIERQLTDVSSIHISKVPKFRSEVTWTLI